MCAFANAFLVTLVVVAFAAAAAADAGGEHHFPLNLCGSGV